MPRSVPSNRTDAQQAEPRAGVPWPDDAGAVLLPLARFAIAERLGIRAEEPLHAGWLDEHGASFVTLHTRGRLRGCIGTISAYRSIADDVRSNARHAAFLDPRFSAVTAGEYAALDLEVSLLSPPEPLACRSDDELLSQLRPGIDGVLLEAGDRRGTFLPQVWDQLPDPRDFLTHLKAKARLDREPWGSDWTVSRYTVTSWSE